MGFCEPAQHQTFWPLPGPKCEGGTGHNGRHLLGENYALKKSRENSDSKFRVCVFARSKKQSIAASAYL